MERQPHPWEPRDATTTATRGSSGRQWALMTNYRVLTEGVNIPAVDMVAHGSTPAPSISQAMGRLDDPRPRRRATPSCRSSPMLLKGRTSTAAAVAVRPLLARSGVPRRDAMMDEVKEDPKHRQRRALEAPDDSPDHRPHRHSPSCLQHRGDDLEAALYRSVERADPRGDNWEEMYGRLLRPPRESRCSPLHRNSGDNQLDHGQ